MKTLVASLLIASLSCSAFAEDPGVVKWSDFVERSRQPADAMNHENVFVGPHDWLVKHGEIQQLWIKANSHRFSRGLPAADLDVEMCLQAQSHAKVMADFGTFQHSRLPYYGILAQVWANNASAEAATMQWKMSPPHEAIMLGGGSRVGFGIAHCQLTGNVYYVGVFK